MSEIQQLFTCCVICADLLEVFTDKYTYRKLDKSNYVHDVALVCSNSLGLVQKMLEEHCEVKDIDNYQKRLHNVHDKVVAAVLKWIRNALPPSMMRGLRYSMSLTDPKELEVINSFH